MKKCQEKIYFENILKGKISHEILNPMNIIVNLSEIIQEMIRNKKL
jgi:hypothetical protein